MISSYTMGVMPTKWYHNENVILLAPSVKVVIGKQTLVRKVQTFKNGSIIVSAK